MFLQSTVISFVTLYSFFTETMYVIEQLGIRSSIFFFTENASNLL